MCGSGIKRQRIDPFSLLLGQQVLALLLVQSRRVGRQRRVVLGNVRRRGRPAAATRGRSDVFAVVAVVELVHHRCSGGSSPVKMEFSNHKKNCKAILYAKQEQLPSHLFENTESANIS